MAFLLMVDDDEDFTHAVTTMLRAEGHEIDVVLDHREAISRMEQRRPDLLILDVMFPEDSFAGFKLARGIKHFNEKLKSVPILILTAVNASFSLGFSSQDLDDLWLPAADFLEKPVDLDVLCGKIRSLLQESAN